MKKKFSYHVLPRYAAVTTISLVHGQARIVLSNLERMPNPITRGKDTRDVWHQQA
ncbi:hypothetical protein [Sphingobacterium suaedae]|uniref:Uncharacterized protein n=1 Tax=Sphingobacterium suaedae TaxID=1686402 RepID=A0ABW5KGC8_9SPHI